GGIFAFRVFNRQIVVINSVSTATDLLDKRARVYSDRPDMAMIPLLGWGFDLAFMRFQDPRYRPHRKIVAQQFSRRLQKFEEVQQAECHQLILSLLEKPWDYFPLIKKFAASIILKTTYGHHLGENEHLIHLATEAVDLLSERVFFGAQLLYAFPFLQHLPWWAPGAGVKCFARKNNPTVQQLLNLPIDLLQDYLATPCWATNLLQQDSRASVTDIKSVTATSYAGMCLSFSGPESPMKSFLLAMILFPECQKQAQAEIDRVVGSGRLPIFEDRAHLPYISTLCREILRWHPSVPLVGVAHAVNEDDVYQGCLIPKGELHWIRRGKGMTRDASIFENPDSFKPERFLNDGKLNDDFCNFIFGFGRRICPGQEYAQATLWLLVVSVLTVFTISKAKDASGKDMDVEERYTETGLISQPLPFPYSLSLRNPHVKILIEQTREQNI
ncbi:cytochrome P450, partial [Mycena rosella]